jgi:hypothetical protein
MPSSSSSVTRNAFLWEMPSSSTFLDSITSLNFLQNRTTYFQKPTTYLFPRRQNLSVFLTEHHLSISNSSVPTRPPTPNFPLPRCQ